MISVTGVNTQVEKVNEQLTETLYNSLTDNNFFNLVSDAFQGIVNNSILNASVFESNPFAKPEMTILLNLIYNIAISKPTLRDINERFPNIDIQIPILPDQADAQIVFSTLSSSHLTCAILNKGNRCSLIVFEGVEFDSNKLSDALIAYSESWDDAVFADMLPSCIINK